MMRVNLETMSEAERTAHNIIVGVSVATGISIRGIMSRARSKSVARARQLAMRRLYDVGPEWSMPRVGRVFERDHTTVLHALRVWPEGS
jgi:chromosomal replication initiation ATPase DnaA